MRTIKKIHKAEYRPIDDLTTYSPLPTKELQNIDPFLFLNHHGPQVYSPNNNGLPFGPHPHRGMETVTFILDGDISHKDSGGYESVITSGGIQWMTAGSGLIHAETSSDNFKKKGGRLEILQLWVNLPANLKMTKPNYLGKQKNEIPSVILDSGKAELNLVSGKFGNTAGAFETLTDIFLSTIHIKANCKLELPVPRENNIFFYMINGKINTGGTPVEALHLVEFNNDSDILSFESESESIILFGYAKPFNEPIVSYGPFVMNSEEEIQQAYADYKSGKFGTWRH
jgi:redox-sensitive bicupin YhaK (pirin superfamily)